MSRKEDKQYIKRDKALKKLPSKYLLNKLLEEVNGLTLDEIKILRWNLNALLDESYLNDIIEAKDKK